MGYLPLVSTELVSLACGGRDTADRRHIMLLKPRQWYHRIVTRDAGYWSEKGHQPALGNQRGDLSTESAGTRSFVHDDAASRLCHRAEQGVLIIGFEGREVDDLCADTFGFERLGSRQRLLHHRAP